MGASILSDEVSKPFSVCLAADDGLNMKVILTLWTLNYIDCVPFSFSDSLNTCPPSNQLIYQKIILKFAKKLDQISINLTNAFAFIA